MRRALAILVTIGGLLVGLPKHASAQSPATQASVAAIILQNLPTNGQQQVTAANVRNAMNALNSAIFQSNPQLTITIGLSLNLNLVADTPFSFFLPNGFPNYTVQAAELYNCTASASSASVALYTGAGATGFALIAPTAVTVSATGPNTLNAKQTLASAAAYSSSTTLYFRNTIAQGSPVTCSAALRITPLP
jgi:hypothetical protein